MLKLTTCLAENSVPLCRHLASFMQTHLDMPVQFIEDISWDERAQQLSVGAIQMGWICGLLFAHLRTEDNAPLHVVAAPIMQGSDYAHRPVYFSRLVVREESAFSTFSHLRGCRLGFNDPGSFSGYAIVRHYLTQLGETDAYFGAWVETGSHANSLQMLLNGRIEATALDSTLLDYWLEKKPNLAHKIRLITTLGPNHSPPMVISAQVPAQLRQQIADLLLNLHQTTAGQSLLAASRVKRFTAVSDHTYQSLYEMSQI